jgi:hypothetical protein
MSGVTQATFMNQRSFGEPPPTVIGQAYGGGFYAGQISTSGDGVATHYLVVAPASSGQVQFRTWKNSQTATPGADSIINGEQNTADMVADGTSTTYPAGYFCYDLSVGGYADWYLPSKNELEILYYNLKPTTTANDTSSGINTNAVPSRGSNYTSGTPAQTTATSFITGGAEALAASSYWSSTEAGGAFYAARQGMGNGLQQNFFKTTTNYVRAVRKVPV